MEYAEDEPNTFQLNFSNGIEILRADSQEEAKDWVEKIVEGKVEVKQPYQLSILRYNLVTIVHAYENSRMINYT